MATVAWGKVDFESRAATMATGAVLAGIRVAFRTNSSGGQLRLAESLATAFDAMATLRTGDRIRLERTITAATIDERHGGLTTCKTARLLEAAGL